LRTCLALPRPAQELVSLCTMSQPSRMKARFCSFFEEAHFI
jgi:hypothetical protein